CSWLHVMQDSGELCRRSLSPCIGHNAHKLGIVVALALACVDPGRTKQGIQIAMAVHVGPAWCGRHPFF
ncbi:hypothetical protein, partial [uncultured Methylibium sp.]|uniref:hypothetical protein n=1 Tax=uncultured Methylibium sp. TaxID=381093 RepID=UPI0025F06E99